MGLTFFLLIIAYLVEVSSFHRGCIRSLKHTHSTVVVMGGEADEQWELFNRHLGSWKGLQTLHDYSNEERNDAQEIVSTRKLNGVSILQKETYIESTNFFVNQEGIDWSSSTPLTVDKVSSKTMAKFGKADIHKMNNKFCHDAIVGGPNIVPNTFELTYQVCLLADGLRLKLLCIYEPFDETSIPGTSFKIPYSFVLSDVILTREIKESGPEMTFVPASMESLSLIGASSLSDAHVSGGQRHQYAHGKCTTEQVPSTPLRLTDRESIVYHKESVPMPDSSSSFDIEGDADTVDTDDDDDEIDMRVLGEHGKDVWLETPRVIVAGERVSARVTWLLPAGSRPPETRSAELFFTAMSNAVKPTKRRGNLNDQIDQPTLEKIIFEMRPVHQP